MKGRRLYERLSNRPARPPHRADRQFFAADMQVHLVNDGPVTIPLRMAPQAH